MLAGCRLPVAVKADVQPGYDLALVWQRIPRTRLQALQLEMETARLWAQLDFLVPEETK